MTSFLLNPSGMLHIKSNWLYAITVQVISKHAIANCSTMSVLRKIPGFFSEIFPFKTLAVLYFEIISAGYPPANKEITNRPININIIPKGFLKIWSVNLASKS